MTLSTVGESLTIVAVERASRSWRPCCQKLMTVLTGSHRSWW